MNEEVVAQGAVILFLRPSDWPDPLSRMLYGTLRLTPQALRPAVVNRSVDIEVRMLFNEIAALGDVAWDSMRIEHFVDVARDEITDGVLISHSWTRLPREPHEIAASKWIDYYASVVAREMRTHE